MLAAHGSKAASLVPAAANHSGALWIAFAVFAALAIGTVLRATAVLRVTAAVRDGPLGAGARERLGSLITWWILAILVIGAALLGLAATAILFTLISGVALREFVCLAPRRELDGQFAVTAIALVPLNYLWIWFGWTGVFAVFMPLASLLLLSCVRLLGGPTAGDPSNLPRVYWGSLLTVYCPAHAVLLMTLPARSNPVAGGLGWFLFLVVLVGANDVAQALVGRCVGRHRIAPRISPRKTWEGFAGGVIGTILLSLVLAPLLTPLDIGRAAVAGLLIALAGFLGDLNMSAVKREAGVEQSSRLLPGQGGMLDRIDSLTFVAPVLYYFVSLTDYLTEAAEAGLAG